MFDQKLEKLAKDLRINAEADSLPVKLEIVSAYDGLILQPLTSYHRFHGKIEFLPDENVFVIYHPDPSTYPYPRRLRFSIAHELGHFYIDEHREALLRGETHSSEPGFRSKNPKELQADEFAAALLIPARLMEATIDKRGFMSLDEVRNVSEKCETSLYATTIRYVKMASEACLVVLAKNGDINSSFSSDEARYTRLGKIQISRLPAASPGHDLAKQFGSTEIRERKHGASVWFALETNITIWENCTHVGDGYTISLLSVERDQEHDE
jgi:hypothetical protein